MTQYWEERYRKGGNSGLGSQGEAAEWKAKRVNTWALYDTLDIGCGDGEQANLYGIRDYKGIDPSASAIMAAADLIDRPNWEFAVLRDGDSIKPRATHMSIDVIYHLVDDHDFYEHMRLLFSANRRVIIYSSDFDSDPEDYAPHVRHRNWSKEVPKRWERVFFQAGPWSPSDLYVYDWT